MINLLTIMTTAIVPINADSRVLPEKTLTECTVQGTGNIVIRSCYKTNLDADTVKDADVNPVNIPYIIDNNGKTIAISINNGALLYNYKPSLLPLIHRGKLPKLPNGSCNVAVLNNPRWIVASQCFQDTININKIVKYGYTKILFKRGKKLIEAGYIKYMSLSVLLLSSDRQNIVNLSGLINLDGKVAYIEGYLNIINKKR